MRRLVPFLLVALLFGSSTPLFAQLPEWVGQLLTATQLPVVADDVRRDGVADDDVRAVLNAMNRAGVSADDAKVVMEAARMPNFGAFVQAQLAAGKRGQALAAAIRAEHARQGKGHAQGQPKKRSGR